MANNFFIPLEAIQQETGFVFGFQGTPFLDLALDRAGLGGRPVAVITAANPASVRAAHTGAQVIGVAAVGGQAEFQALIEQIKGMKAGDQPQAIVFHGLSEYAQHVLSGICGTKSPEQSQYGVMAREVSNDLRKLMALASVVYVTCDVVLDVDDKTKVEKTRLNIIPGLQKLILGDLAAKLYVVRRGDETLVQDNGKLALDFIAPRRERPAEDGSAQAAPGSAASNGKRRRRL